MARQVYQQRRIIDPRQQLRDKGVKFNEGDSVVKLEDAGEPGDLLRQKTTYEQEWYEKIHGDADGIWMATSREQNEANQARWLKESNDRLEATKSGPDLGPGYENMKVTTQIGRPISANQFFQSADKEEPVG